LTLDLRNPRARENPARKSGLYPIVRFWRFAILIKDFDSFMLPPSFDIFRRDAGGHLVWVEAVQDLETPKSRIIELSATAPGQYAVFSQRSGRMVSSGTIVASPAARTTRKEWNNSSRGCADSTTVGSDTSWK
jgi:hypothetical protein